MLDPASLVITSVKLVPSAIKGFKDLHAAIQGPVQIAARKAEKEAKSRLRSRKGVDVDLAIEKLKERDATWIVAFVIWEGSGFDGEATAARWAEAAGASLGIGEFKLEAARDLMGAFVDEFRFAAAEGKGGRGYHELQEERRHRETHSLLSEMMASFERRDQGAKYRDKADELKGRLSTAVDKANTLHLKSALSLLISVLDELDTLRGQDPQSEGIFLGLRQLALALKGQVFGMEGDIPARRGVAGVLKEGGPIVPEAIRPVALFAADIGDEDWLRKLVPQLPANSPERPFLEVVVDTMANGYLDPELVLQRTSGQESDVNLLGMRVDALTNAVTADRAVEAVALLSALEAAEGSEEVPLSPRKGLLVGQKRFCLLRKVVEDRIETVGLDRQYLLDSARHGLQQAVGELAQLGDEFMGAHVEALVEMSTFLHFVEEYKASDDARKQVNELQPEDGPIGAIAHQDVTTHEQIAQLEAQEIMSPSHKSLLMAQQFLGQNDLRRAKRHFGAALESASTISEREMALDHYINALLRKDQHQIGEAELLLDEERDRRPDNISVRPDFLGVLLVRLAKSRSGVEAALEESEAQLAKYRNSYFLLRQRRSMLEREVLAEMKRIAEGEGTGRRKLKLINKIEQNSRALYRILPAPQYLVDQGRVHAERQQGPQAQALLCEAVSRGIQDEALKVEVKEYGC